jgi:hypothetical protein
MIKYTARTKEQCEGAKIYLRELAHRLNMRGEETHYFFNGSGSEKVVVNPTTRRIELSEVVDSEILEGIKQILEIK